MTPNTANTQIRLIDVQYWINWLASGYSSGKWASFTRGRGFDFQGIAPYVGDPDFIRINWPATINQREVQVSQFSEEKCVNIYVLGNLSPSMAFGSNQTKIDRLAILAAVMAFSTYKSKDHFRFVGYANDLENGFPKYGNKMYPFLLAKAIMNFDWRGKSKGGLVKAALKVAQTKSLVLIVSDFLGSPEIIDQSLRILASRHEVVPIVLWDQLEVELPGKGWGFYPLQDLETHEQTYVFLTDKVREKYRQQCLSRREALEKIFMRYGIKPIFMVGDLQNSDMEMLMRAFLIKRNRT